MTEALQKAVETLVPCPFCGVSHSDVSNRYTDHYQVHCMHCGVDGPSGARLEIAITTWNRRAALAEPDHVALIVAWLRDKAEEELRRSRDNKGTRLGPCAAYAALALKQEAGAIERRAYLPEGTKR